MKETLKLLKDELRQVRLKLEEGRKAMERYTQDMADVAAQIAAFEAKEASYIESIKILEGKK